jgi:hypothetical protein
LTDVADATISQRPGGKAMKQQRFIAAGNGARIIGFFAAEGVVS